MSAAPRRVTPVLDVDALGRLGFRIVIFPGGTARAVAHTLQRYYGALKKDEAQRLKALEAENARL